MASEALTEALNSIQPNLSIASEFNPSNSSSLPTSSHHLVVGQSSETYSVAQSNLSNLGNQSESLFDFPLDSLTASFGVLFGSFIANYQAILQVNVLLKWIVPMHKEDQFKTCFKQLSV